MRAFDRIVGMKSITPAEAQKVIQNGSTIVIDVRTPAEFTDGHIKGAKNIDFYEDGFDEMVKKLDKNATYVVNCLSGGRSSKACSIFDELGFKDTVNLEGGIGAWKNAGLLVESN